MPKSTAKLGTEATAGIDVSVVAVSYNTAHLLGKMWDALTRSRAHIDLEMIVVDNASRDDSLHLLRTRPEFTNFKIIENQRNVGFGRANNQGVAVASGRYVLLLNTDAFVSQDTLSTVLAFMDSHPECGVAGTRLVGGDGLQQPNCRSFPTVMNLFLARCGLARLFPWVRMIDSPRPDQTDKAPTMCDWVTGCFMMIRREVIEAIGLFDPRFFLYFEEVDFCRSVKGHGWNIVYLPATEVTHLGGESAKSESALTESGQQISPLQIESEILYVRKHFGLPGLVGHACLSWLADGILAIKWLARRRNTKGLVPIREHSFGFWTLLFATHWGSQPTR